MDGFSLPPASKDISSSNYGSIERDTALPPTASKQATASTKTTDDTSPLLQPLKPQQQDQSKPDSFKRNLSLKNLKSKFQSNGSTKSLTPDSQAIDSMYTSDEQDFMNWIDSELNKVESFYKTKETEAIERYLILQDQLFNLREQKYASRFKNKKKTLSRQSKTTIKKIKTKLNRRFDLPSLPENVRNFLFKTSSNPEKEDEHQDIRTLERIEEEDTISPNEILKPATATTPLVQVTSTDTSKGNSNNLTQRKKTSSPEDISMTTGKSKDYTRRIKDQQIPYGVARRQLKLAVVELYRGLEMLKSYRSLNQTGFRKMMKKFDKVTGHRSLAGFMSKVNKCYFSQSEILDDLIEKTETMFAYYFEHGNHKHAVEKLRANAVHEDYYMEMFITGLGFGLSVPFGIKAAWKGVENLNNGDPDALFLFQIWGGFFLVILFMSLFTINCIVWKKFKINYPFVFEFNPLNHLESHQVGSVPAFLMFCLTFLAWLCFEDFWPDTLPAVYYPPIFLVFTVIILFLPFNFFHQEARKWLYVVFWRVSLSGFYPVEFRDLIMGDICCSLTYSISNAAFFFCLYATHWSGLLPGSTSGSHCGSSHSRWMGFLSALPGIWRFLQCGRRYLDSGDAFPHLANMAKYTMLILYNAFLSAYRIDLSSNEFRSLFILFASLNTIYSSFWDLFMDWSLMDWGSKNFMLRDELAFKHTWIYYIAVVVDPLLRCNWIFYAIYANEVQQSAKVSFFVALSELVRRFIWVFFRVENEHCSNVQRFRASRDITLPYTIVKKKKIQAPTKSGTSPEISGRPEQVEIIISEGQQIVHRPKIVDEEAQIGLEPSAQQPGPSTSEPTQDQLLTSTAGKTQKQHDLLSSTTTKQESESIGMRMYHAVEPFIHAVGHSIRSAHVRDFERRKDKPKDPDELSNSIESDEDDDDDEDDEYADDSRSIRSVQSVNSEFASADANEWRHKYL